jgi:hypothetical protein
MKRYEATWSVWLIGLSSFLTILCLGIAIGVSQRSSGALWWLAWLPVALALGCTLFSIRGYTITPDAILVHRLVWNTSLSRAGLESARFVPNAMRWSIRTFGNGGFFSFSGFYWNKTLGAYRAYVTDPARTVVLHYRSSRTVLLSPASPEDFVNDLRLPNHVW